jgi:transposase InsO family protein
VTTHHIDPGSPWQNAYGESFNEKLRTECLNLELLETVEEARVVPGGLAAAVQSHPAAFQRGLRDAGRVRGEGLQAGSGEGLDMRKPAPPGSGVGPGAFGVAGRGRRPIRAGLRGGRSKKLGLGLLMNRAILP